MGELIRVNFKGREVIAEISEDGRYSVKLPDVVINGIKYNQSLDKELLSEKILGRAEEAWVYSLSRPEDENDNSRLCLLNDGRLLASNPDVQGVYVDVGRFSKTKTPSTDLERQAREIYLTGKQVDDYAKIGMFAEEVGELRKKRLALVLRMLGFESPSDIRKPVDGSKSYFSLSRVGEMLEKFKNMSYVQRELNEDGSESFIVASETPDRTSCRDLAILTRTAIEDDERVMREFDEMIYGREARGEDEALRGIRNISGGEQFLLGMRETMETEDPAGYHQYAEMVRRVAQFIIALNPDLVDESVLEGIPLNGTRYPDKKLTELQGLELADEISQLTDSREFSEAWLFENMWFIRESERVEEVLSGTELAAYNDVLRLYKMLQNSRAEREKSVRTFNYYRNVGRQRSKELEEAGRRTQDDELIIHYGEGSGDAEPESNNGEGR